MVELWHEWNSVQSFRVRAVLAEKQIDWQGHLVELLRFDQLQPGYLALNPDGVVPTLRHDCIVLTESSVICEYLDEVSATPSLLPRDPIQRARTRIWCKRFDDVGHPAIRQASFELLYRAVLQAMPTETLRARLQVHPHPAKAKRFLQAAHGEPEFGQVEAALDVFASVLRRIDNALAVDAWLSGPSFGLADIAWAALVDRMDDLGVARLATGFPAVEDWAARLRRRPSIGAAVAPASHRLSVPADSTRTAVEQLLAARRSRTTPLPH